MSEIRKGRSTSWLICKACRAVIGRRYADRHDLTACPFCQARPFAVRYTDTQETTR